MIRLTRGNMITPLASFANGRNDLFHKLPLFIRQIDRILYHYIAFKPFPSGVERNERFTKTVMLPLNRRSIPAVQACAVSAYCNVIVHNRESRRLCRRNSLFVIVSLIVIIVRRQPGIPFQKLHYIRRHSRRLPKTGDTVSGSLIPTSRGVPRNGENPLRQAIFHTEAPRHGGKQPAAAPEREKMILSYHLFSLFRVIFVCFALKIRRRARRQRRELIFMHLPIFRIQIRILISA